MAVDFKTFLSVSAHVLDVGLPVLIRGRHGVGKSEVVYMTAKSRALPVVERRASQMTEGDLLGLPDSTDLADGRRATTWNAPDWLVQACTEPVLLFLDEVDRATLEVRQGLFELTDSRKINGWKLHPGTLIVAAVNGGEHGSQYQVGEMDPAELDRWTVFDVEPSTEDWLTWAKDNVHTIVREFIIHNSAHLEHKDDFEPNKVYPSRRSWKRFNDTGLRSRVFEKGADDVLIYQLANSFLGFEAAAAFGDFVRNYEHAVTAEEVIDDGVLSFTEGDWTINDQMAMVEKILSSARLRQGELNSNAVQNIVKFWNTLSGETAMMMFTSISLMNDETDGVDGASLIITLHPYIRTRLAELAGVHADEK